MTSRIIPAILIVLPLGLASAQVSSEHAETIKNEGLNNSQAMKFLDHLTNKIGYRLTGSDNFTMACEWARDEFAKMGLDAKLEKWTEWNVVWNRGQWSGRVLKPEVMELQVATPAWTPGTKGRQRGELVAMPDVDTLNQSDGAYKGKFLFGRIPSYRSSNTAPLMKAVEASGALGIVGLPSGGGDRRYKTQIRVFGNSNVARGSMQNIPRVPLICVRPDQHKKLEQMVEAGKPPVVEFEIRNRFRKGPIAIHNVVAELKGSQKPDEAVIVCGHLDSWHQAAGATDNGTGTCSTLEAARILTTTGMKPRRTIRFILWGGEEQGLLGSKQYVTMHRQEMKNVSAVFNHDSGTNWAHSLTISEAMEATMRKVLEPVFSIPAPQEGYEEDAFVLRVRPTISARGGSDHASFGIAGVPAFGVGLQSQGNTPYGYGWHSQWDTYDLAVPKYQAHTSTVVALTAFGVANLPKLLTREGVVRSTGRRTGRGGTADLYVGAIFGGEMKGATFAKVTKDGLAEKAGVKAGDKIVEINGQKMNRTFELIRAVRDRVKTIELTLERGDKKVKAKFDTAELVKRQEANPDRRRRRGGNDGGTQGGERRRRRGGA